MLSNENKLARTPEEVATAWRDAAYAAKRLGTQLMRYERNEDPHEERNAPNPAHGVHIRLLRPRPRSIGWGDDVAVRQHNEFVSSLGASGQRFGS